MDRRSENAERQRIRALVCAAFADVSLGNGVGLLQGQALDGYAGDEAQAAARAMDEKLDWSCIPANLLNSAHSSLSFFDPEGMRFHLPAYLVADLYGTLDQDILFHLAFAQYDAQSRFALLAPQQREAVRQFLLFRLSDPNFYFERETIEQALQDHWNID